MNELDISTKIERPGGNTAILDISVPPELVVEELAAIYKKLSKQANIPGFRKGKIPHDVIDRYFGSGVLEELVDSLLPRSYEFALAEHELRPINQPSISLKQITKEGPFEYQATVDLIPEIELPEYSALAAKQTVRKAKVTKKQVDEALQEIRERNANLVPVEDRASEKEDLVILEFLEEPPAGFNEDTVAIWAGMEDNFVSRQVLGHLTNDTFSLEIEYPEDFDNKELAGITVKTSVKVVEIKTKELPELDDDFAVDIGVENLADLKKQVKKDLMLNDADMARYESLGKLFDEVVKSSSVGLSDGFIERKVCEMKAVKSLEDIEEDTAEMLDETRSFFTRYFIVEEIAKRESISVSDEEIESIRESQVKRGGYAQGKGEIYDYLLNMRLADTFFPAEEKETTKKIEEK